MIIRDQAAAPKKKSPAAGVAPRGLSPVETRAPDFVAAPRLYLIAVGVGKYGNPTLQLTYPAKDARDLAAAFSRQRQLLYREVNTRLLVDEQATKAQILDGLEWMQRQTTAHDVAVFFFAGHGINDPGTGRYHFLPVDADPTAIKRSMISQDEIQSTLRSVAGKVLFFLDTCHSGNLFGDWAGRGTPDLLPFIKELSRSDNGVVVFAASTSRQVSQEAARWSNGAFTKAVVEGLGGKAAFVTGRPITVNMLDLYISERVKELTQGLQTPATAKPSTLPDFPIAVAMDATVPIMEALVPAPGASVPANEVQRQSSLAIADAQAAESKIPSRAEDVQAACQKKDRALARDLYTRLPPEQKRYLLFFCEKLGVDVGVPQPMDIQAACQQREAAKAKLLYGELEPKYKSLVHLFCLRQGVDLGAVPPRTPGRDPQVVELQIASVLKQARELLETDPKKSSILLTEALEDYGDHGSLWLLYGMAACKQKDRNNFFAAYRRLDVAKQRTLLDSCRTAGAGELIGR